MDDFLTDKSFLLKVNKIKTRQYYAAIMVLDFETERPLARLEGKVISGNLNVAANSPTRKTASLSLIFDGQTKDITNINNLIAINKKISLSIGITNPFYHTEEYEKYGQTLWFKQGLFFITKASSSISTSGAIVSVELMDKMAQLNGTIGGVIPASTSFHDRIIIQPNGDTITEYPLISDIIRECVHHFGGEHFTRISIEDVPPVGRVVVRYMGNTPINFQTTVNRMNSGRSFIIGAPPIKDFEDTYVKGDNIGYMETPLTYPGELIMKAGSTVTQVLDSIKDTLGNFEYFYDVDGIFHFRKIPNFTATGKTPLNFTDSETRKVETIDEDGNPTTEMVEVSYDKDLQSLYFPKFTDDQFINEFANSELIVSANYAPDYSRIKNDFVCWGSKQKSDSSAQTMVRYHLAIDERPKDYPKPENLKNIELIMQFLEDKGYKIGDTIPKAVYDEIKNIPEIGAEEEWMTYFEYKDNDEIIFHGDPDYQDKKNYKDTILDNYSLCHKDIWSIKDINTGAIVRYGIKMDELLDEAKEDWYELVAPNLDEKFSHLPSVYWFNWREELYRRALVAYGSSTEGSAYDQELLAEWRQIYDPTNTTIKNGADSFQKRWEDHYGSGNEETPWAGYNVDVLIAPEKLRYWLDIIDTQAELGKYSVKRIGRRSKVTENTKINEVFEASIPDIVFIMNDQGLEKMQENTKYYISIGQAYSFINPDQASYFKQVNSFGTCFEDVRAQLYDNLIYHASVNLTCIPIFYLDVNKVVRLNLPEIGIVGDFVINSISWSFNNGATMSLQLNEAVVMI